MDTPRTPSLAASVMISMVLATVVLVTVVVVILLATMDDPPRPGVPPRHGVVTPTAGPDRSVELSLCRSVSAGESKITVPSYGIDYMLSLLAQQYVAEPTPGAREQVLVECRRLELL